MRQWGKAVRPGSKAAGFGLQPGGSIVPFGDVPANWRGLLRAARKLRRWGEFPRMTVLRAGARVELKPPPHVPHPREPAPAASPR